MGGRDKPDHDSLGCFGRGTPCPHLAQSYNVLFVRIAQQRTWVVKNSHREPVEEMGAITPFAPKAFPFRVMTGYLPIASSVRGGQARQWRPHDPRHWQRYDRHPAH
jgi:hypothetical protein